MEVRSRSMMRAATAAPERLGHFRGLPRTYLTLAPQPTSMASCLGHPAASVRRQVGSVCWCRVAGNKATAVSTTIRTKAASQTGTKQQLKVALSKLQAASKGCKQYFCDKRLQELVTESSTCMDLAHVHQAFAIINEKFSQHSDSLTPWSPSWSRYHDMFGNHWHTARQLAASAVTLAATSEQAHCQEYIRELVHTYELLRLKGPAAVPFKQQPAISQAATSPSKPAAAAPAARKRKTQAQAARQTRAPGRRMMSAKTAAASAAAWVAAQQAAAEARAEEAALEAEQAAAAAARAASERALIERIVWRSDGEARAAVAPGVAAAEAASTFGGASVLVWLHAFLSALPSRVIQLSDPAGVVQLVLDDKQQLFWEAVYGGMDAAVLHTLQHGSFTETLQMARALPVRATVYSPKHSPESYARLQSLVHDALHSLACMMQREWSSPGAAPPAFEELDAAAEVLKCVTDLREKGSILFEPDQQWMGSFVAATRGQMGRMSPGQLARLLLQAHAAGLDFGPEWLVSWRAAATTKLRVMPAQELPTVLYAHGQMAARTGSQPRQHVAAASTATLQQGAASAEVLPGSRDLAQQSPHTVAQPAEYVPVGELLQFLVAAAKRYKGDKTGSAVFRFSSMAALGTGMYGLVLAAQALPPREAAALASLPTVVALRSLGERELSLALTLNNVELPAVMWALRSIEAKYKRTEKALSALFTDIPHLLFAVLALGGTPPPEDQVEEYIHMIEALCLRVTPPQLLMAMEALQAYEARTAGATRLSREWMTYSLKTMQMPRLKRCSERGMHGDAAVLLELLRSLQQWGVKPDEQFITQAERLLLEQPDAFSDTQVWDFVAELRALGMPLGSSHARAAAAAAEAARQAADTPSAAHKKAEETAAAEAAWQQQLQAVGERLARHFAALGPEQRAVALAAASDCSDVQNPSQT